MKKSSLLISVLCIVTVFFITSCITSHPKTAYEGELERQYGPYTIWASEETSPSWWNQPPHETSDGAIYSVGVSRGYKELRDAIEDARMDSAAQIAQYYGMKITSEYSDVRSIGTSGNQNIQSEETNEAIKKSFNMMVEAIVTGIEYVDQVDLMRRESGENSYYVRFRAKVSKDKKDTMIEALKEIATINIGLISNIAEEEIDPVRKRELMGVLDSYRMFLNL